jgi:hypothetical protein
MRLAIGIASDLERQGGRTKGLAHRRVWSPGLDRSTTARQVAAYEC